MKTNKNTKLRRKNIPGGEHQDRRPAGSRLNRQRKPNKNLTNTKVPKYKNTSKNEKDTSKTKDTGRGAPRSPASRQ